MGGTRASARCRIARAILVLQVRQRGCGRAANQIRCVKADSIECDGEQAAFQIALPCIGCEYGGHPGCASGGSMRLPSDIQLVTALLSQAAMPIIITRNYRSLAGQPYAPENMASASLMRPSADAIDALTAGECLNVAGLRRARSRAYGHRYMRGPAGIFSEKIFRAMSNPGDGVRQWASTTHLKEMTRALYLPDLLRCQEAVRR